MRWRGCLPVPWRIHHLETPTTFEVADRACGRLFDPARGGGVVRSPVANGMLSVRQRSYVAPNVPYMAAGGAVSRRPSSGELETEGCGGHSRGAIGVLNRLGVLLRGVSERCR